MLHFTADVILLFKSETYFYQYIPWNIYIYIWFNSNVSQYSNVFIRSKNGYFGAQYITWTMHIVLFCFVIFW